MIRLNGRSFYLPLFLVTFFFVSIASHSRAADVEFSWNASPSASGYKIYYGFGSRNYHYVIDIGNWTECSVSGLQRNQVYYFAVTAYNDYAESYFSEEIVISTFVCIADLDQDDDTDGSDLKEFVSDPSALVILDFADRFGLANCSND